MATIPASMKAPVDALGQAANSPAAQSKVQPTDSSADHLTAPEVPVGVLEVPVGVWGIVCVPSQPEPLKQFSEETCTVIVFPHGAVIRLSAAVVPGQMVLVANRNSHQEVLCRVINVKKYPNVKGYVEIQFNQPTDGFWGPYDPQGAVRSPDKVMPPAAKEKSAKPQTAASTPASTPIPKSVSTPASTPAAATPRPNTPVADPDDFWSSSFPTEILAPAPNVRLPSDAPPMIVASSVSPNSVRTKPESTRVHSVASPSVKSPVRGPATAAPKSATKAQPRQAKVTAATLPSTSSGESTQSSRQRLETLQQQSESSKDVSTLSSVRDLLHSWWKQISTSGAMEGARFSSRTIVVTEATVVVLFVLGAAAFFFFHRGQSAADPTNSALLVASMAANTVQGVPSASTPAPVASQPPTAVAPQSQPASQALDSTSGIRALQAVPREPAPKKPVWSRRIPNTRFSFSHATSRPAATTVRAAPPDLTAAPLYIAGDAMRAVLPASSKILLGLPSNPQQAPPAVEGGHLREPQLISRIPPNYPIAAKQTGVEGKVVLSAVIDTTGKATSLKVISGPAPLRRAAVEAVGQWRYTPRYLDGKPVPAETTITIDFRLH